MIKKLKGKSCSRVGVFAAKFKGHYQTEIITGIKKAAERLNVQVIYFCGYSLQSPYPYEESHNLVYDSAIHASLDGLIIFPILANFCDNKVLSDFFARYNNIPVINLHHHSPLGNTILSNNETGFTSLMNHLIEKHHFKKLAFIKGPECSLNAHERYKIYKSSLTAAGIPIDPALIADGNYRYHSGIEAIGKFLDTRGLDPHRDIDCIICANDTMAIGVIDELNKRGLYVPGDIAVTGFDNIEKSFSSNASLTTVNQHLREIGDKAVCSLLDYKPHQKPLYFDTDLIIRHSCECSQPKNIKNQPSDPDNKSECSENIRPDEYKLYLEFTIQEIYTSLNSLKC